MGVPSDYSFNTLVNVIFRKQGVFGPPVFDDSILKDLSPEKKKDYLDAYKENLKIAASDIEQTSHFSNYMNGYDGPTKTAMSVLPEIIQIEADLKFIDGRIADIGAQFHPDDLKGYIQKEQTDVITQIKNVHVTELAKKPDAEKEAFKKIQEKQLADLEKAFTDDLIKIHRAAQMERDRVAILGTLWSTDPAFRNRFIEQHDSKKPAVRVGGIGTIDPIKELSGIKLADIAEYKTLSGSTISCQNGKLSISITEGSLFGNGPWFRGSDTRNLLKVDMLMFAQRYKASSTADTVHFRFDETRPSEDGSSTRRVAQAAFEAFLEVGFDKDKIKITMNGKEMKPEEIFPHGMSAALQKASVTQKQLDGVHGNRRDQKEVKRIMDEGRTQYNAAAAGSPAAADRPTVIAGADDAQASTTISGESSTTTISGSAP